jgi:hypothetical protein
LYQAVTCVDAGFQKAVRTMVVTTTSPCWEKEAVVSPLEFYDRLARLMFRWAKTPCRHYTYHMWLLWSKYNIYKMPSIQVALQKVCTIPTFSTHSERPWLKCSSNLKNTLAALHSPGFNSHQYHKYPKLNCVLQLTTFIWFIWPRKPP